MPRETRYDSIDINPPELSFDPLSNPVADPRPHSNSVTNMVYTPTGAIHTRAPFTQFADVKNANELPVRVWEYSTLPKNSIIYRFLIASVKVQPTTSPPVYKLYYSYFSYEDLGGINTGLSTGWTAFPDLRDCNASIRAHIIAFSRGRAYIKGFPDGGSSEKLGTIVFDANDDPSSPDVYLWGLPAPTTPARISGAVTRLTSAATATDGTLNVDSTSSFPASGTLWLNYEVITYAGKTASTFTGCTRGVSGTDASSHDTNSIIVYRDWSAASHRIDVNRGWYYAYAWKSVTGQISNRSDIERNPDLLPSFTGPFFDLVPKLTVQGHADTTNIPKIVIFRSTDGGGTFYFLEEITNTGAGSITYLDDSFGTGASSSTFNDPVPDAKLDTGYVAPSLTTNSPPPTVNPPLVVGTDTASRSCYAMETFLGRIFFHVDNYLYFSSREELREGVGEECFVSGNSGNFIVFNELITGLAATFEALYIGTTDGIFKLSGSSRETLQVTKISSIPVQGGEQKVCMVAADQDVYFHSLDFGLFYKISNDAVEHISPLLSNTQNSASSQLLYYRAQRYEMLIWASNAGGGSAGVNNSSWSIYDITQSKKLNRHIWAGQWTVVNSCCACVARIGAGFTGIISGTYNSLGEKWMFRQQIQPAAIGGTGGCNDVIIDLNGDVATTTGSQSFNLAGITPPAGNHINLVNKPTRPVKFGHVYLYYYDGYANYGPPTSVVVTVDGETVPNVVALDYSPRVPAQQTSQIKIFQIPVDQAGYNITGLLIANTDTTKSLSIFRIVVETSSNYSAVP